MKFRVEVEGKACQMQLQSDGTLSEYAFTGDLAESGAVSVVRVKPGVYSVLFEGRSLTVYLSKRDDQYEAWVENQPCYITLSDIRARGGKQRANAGSGPAELRSQMPGRIIRLLVNAGAEIEAGQSLLVIEAMKMQNELKSPKSGRVSKIKVAEGAAVNAGQILLVIE